MKVHWPFLVGLIMLAAAAALGLGQQKLAMRVTERRPAEADSSGIKMFPAIQPAPAPAPQPAAVVPAPPAPPAPSPAPPAPPGVMPAVPEPLAPQPMDQPPVRPGADPRSMLLLNLKGRLEAKLGVEPSLSPEGVYSLKANGVRVEVRPLPNWRINIYNLNPAAPTTETENFRQSVIVTGNVLAIDLSIPLNVTETGAAYRTTGSRMGKLSIQRDPANGNSYMFQPLGPAVSAHPAQPAAPVPAPAPTPALPAKPPAPPQSNEF